MTRADALLDAVADRVAAERLVDETGHPIDIAYNQAIADALAAITAMKAGR